MDDEASLFYRDDMFSERQETDGEEASGCVSHESHGVSGVRI